MATITPSTGAPRLENPADVNQLERLTWYDATLSKIHWVTGAAEYGSKRRMVLDWTLDNGAGNVRDYANLALGTSANGQVARLKTILNAIAGKTESENIVLFHDDEGDDQGQNKMSWSYDGKTYTGTLKPGVRVRFHGKIQPRKDGQGSVFTIEEYEPAGSPKPAQATPATPQVPATNGKVTTPAEAEADLAGI